MIRIAKKLPQYFLKSTKIGGDYYVDARRVIGVSTTIVIRY